VGRQALGREQGHLDGASLRHRYHAGEVHCHPGAVAAKSGFDIAVGALLYQETYQADEKLLGDCLIGKDLGCSLDSQGETDAASKSKAFGHS